MPQPNWHQQRILKICENYERLWQLFSKPDPKKGMELANFMREIGEVVGYRSSGGEDGSE